MLLEILAGLLILLGALYRWITKSFDKWEKEGIPHDKPSFPFGTHSFITQNKHLNDYVHEDYNKFKIGQKLKVHGWFLLGKPALSINDVDILKKIQVKDFNHFVDRNETKISRSFGAGGKLDKLWGLQMTNASGDKWKDIRSAFTPIFTSGKMKVMLTFIKETAGGLTKELGQKAEARKEFDLKDTFGKFSLDALASSAFGVNPQSFESSTSVFVKHAAAVFLNSPSEQLIIFMALIPGISHIKTFLGINTFKPRATKYLSDCITHAIKARRESGERRNDMIDLMLDCIKEGEKVDENENEDTSSQYDKDMMFEHVQKHGKITEDEIVATALVFLVAGYDTTGMTLSFLAYQMSKNPEIQERLQQEIDQAFEDHNGAMPDYATIQGLPYIDMVIHETLRLHAPVGLNTRSCTEDYKLPGTEVTVRRGDLLTFSVSGIHRDPEHYSHPDQFYPDHFSKEEKAARHPYVSLSSIAPNFGSFPDTPSRPSVRAPAPASG